MCQLYLNKAKGGKEHSNMRLAHLTLTSKYQLTSPWATWKYTGFSALCELLCSNDTF